VVDNDRVTNRLAKSSSPYLLQHAHNPVDWWEWVPEAFEEARRRDVPILVSIGYSACHWCHVMAHESFEDADTADYLNPRFVAIKVDREERPDVDAVYMAATQAMTGQGGWPMTVFVDHDGHPFYAGTYFPREPRGGMPTFRQLLVAVDDAWRTKRGELEAGAARIVEAVRESTLRASSTNAPASEEQLDACVDTLARGYDGVRGGFGTAPKFPPSMVIEFLLRNHARTADPRAMSMVEGTCEAMARGGMYDQLAGGFARYSVDADWVVPHFEKMLYDNALLLRVYLHWWRATGSALARRVALETADFLLDDLRTPEGGFASALDADSEGVEGRYYSWTPGQLHEVLGADDGAWVANICDVTASGTFEEGASVLQLRRDPDDWTRWLACKGQLRVARQERVAPGRDDKIVAAWNGLAIAALAETGVLLAEPKYVEAAIRAAVLVRDVHRPDPLRPGRIRRVSRDGVVGAHAGVLDDHACVAEGILTLYSATGDAQWIDFAGELLDEILEHYRDSDGGFFDVADDGPVLISRPQDPTDNASPSGWTAAAGALLTYAALTGSQRHRDAAESALAITSTLSAHPRFAGWGLSMAEAWIDGPREIAIVGAPEDPARAALHRVAFGVTAPGAVVAVGTPTEEPATSDQRVGLLQDRPSLDGVSTAYVCRQFTCLAPVTSAADLAAQVNCPRWEELAYSQPRARNPRA